MEQQPYNIVDHDILPDPFEDFVTSEPVIDDSKHDLLGEIELQGKKINKAHEEMQNDLEFYKRVLALMRR